MIEEGEMYTTRGGRRVGPMIKDGRGDFTHDGCFQVWKSDGTVWCEIGDQSDDYIDFIDSHATTNSTQYIDILEVIAGYDAVNMARKISEALQ